MKLTRRSTLVQDAIEATQPLSRQRRPLTATPLRLTDDVQPRPHAGRKSRRTHARRWEIA
jgi:hypothetical protein